MPVSSHTQQMTGQEAMASSCAGAGSHWLFENLFTEGVIRYWNRLAQGSGGFTAPEGISEMSRCGAEGHGLLLTQHS